MRNLLAVIAGLIAIVATLPYIVDTTKGKTHPNIITWFTWGLLSGVTAVAAGASGAVQTAIFASLLAACDIAIVLAGLRSGIRRYTIFDVICQILAIIGIILWRITNEPALAILLNIISDLIGALPTYRHIWHDPHRETLSTFVLAMFSALVAIIAIENYKFTSAGYPIYIFFSATSFAVLILLHRRHSALASTK